MDFREFLKTRRESLGYSQNKFSKIIKITQSYLNSIERGEVKNPPSEEVLGKIAVGLQLNEDETNELFYLAAIERTPSIILETLDKLEDKLNHQSMTQVNDSIEFGDSIPVFERISAGRGAFADEEISDYLVIPGLRNNGNIFAVNVVGDSMEPTIKDGSIIICKRETELRNGDIGAFFVDDEAYVKRLKLTKSHACLISDNPNYTPIYIGPGENLRVVGKVIKVLSDI